MYHLAFTFISGSLAAFVLFHLPAQYCSISNSTTVLLAYAIAIYAGIKLVLEISKLIAKRLEGLDRKVVHCLCAANFKGQLGDDVAGGLASQIMLILAYNNAKGLCYGSAMGSTSSFYYAVLVLLGLTILMNFVGDHLSKYGVQFGLGGVSRGVFWCCILLCFVIFVFGFLISFTVFYVMLAISYFSPKNDCKKNVPNLEFFMAYAVWSAGVYLTVSVFQAAINKWCLKSSAEKTESEGDARTQPLTQSI
eukprot:TRINITY_DN4069_c0_g1_i1.p2 TRINITY_DN4069_c0_g1~~TRINITY_DN4069_c0_g1_i1.p2  ORF type:complete len:250 (-),score=33.80 TRINITY_DN4069_c0_g1_i1:131-880(-)